MGDVIDIRLEDLVRQLEQERDEINTEIISYPPPIPACDAQFNHLLEKRAQLTQRLSQLRATQKSQKRYV